MGLFKAPTKAPTVNSAVFAIVILLTVFEGGLAYLERTAQVASLKRELATRQAELNRLIFLRDAEHRHQAALTAPSRAVLAAAAAPAPAAAPEKLPEDDLFEATAQSFEADTLSAPQGASALSPSDIDPKHLVNMANIMNGRAMAELTRFKGQSMIRYKTTQLRDDEPVWQILDAVSQAHDLRGVTLVSAGARDEARLKKLAERIASSGIPPSSIRVKAGDSGYQGFDGILITLAKSAEGRNP